MTTWENNPSEKPHRMVTVRGESSSDGAWARLRTAQVRQRTIAERLAQVRVKGVSDSAGSPVVLVDLQGLRMEQAAGPICAQAEGWLKRSLGGTSLRIQSFRDDQPARDAGVIRCT